MVQGESELNKFRDTRAWPPTLMEVVDARGNTRRATNKGNQPAFHNFMSYYRRSQYLETDVQQQLVRAKEEAMAATKTAKAAKERADVHEREVNL